MAAYEGRHIVFGCSRSIFGVYKIILELRISVELILVKSDTIKGHTLRFVVKIWSQNIIYVIIYVSNTYI